MEKLQILQLQVPPQYLPESSDEVLEATALSKQVSDDSEIQEVFKKMLLQSDDEERLRKRYDRIFTKNHPKYKAYKLALNTYFDITEKHAKDLLQQADTLLKTIKEEVLQ